MAADLQQSLVQWRDISEATPVGDGDVCFIGVNSAGFAACFQHYRGGCCWYETAEDGAIPIMSGLKWWAVLHTPGEG